MVNHKKKYKVISLIILILVTTTFGLFSAYQKSCPKQTLAINSNGTSPVINKTKIDPGYNLITTLTPPGGKRVNNGTVYLTDMLGNPLHSWQTSPAPFYAKLAPNGHLFVSLMNISTNPNLPSAASVQVIEELDWKGQIKSSITLPEMHHDFDILPNGNLAVITWEVLLPNFASRIQGGVPGTELNGQTFGDKLLEVDPKGQIMWEWSVKDHLDPTKYPLGPLVARDQWGHANSIQYIASDPIYHEEAYLISLRTLNTLLLINKKNGNILWESPHQLLNHQHDASLLNNGNILVFDNGFYTRPQVISYGSRVLEIDPTTNKIVWQFSGGDNALEKSSFWSPILSAVQRLPNGNTMIMKGVGGEFMEVTPEKQVVWDMINPFTIQGSGAFPSRNVFKARRYFPGQIQFPEKLPDPLPARLGFCR